MNFFWPIILPRSNGETVTCAREPFLGLLALIKWLPRRIPPPSSMVASPGELRRPPFDKKPRARPRKRPRVQKSAPPGLTDTRCGRSFPQERMKGCACVSPLHSWPRPRLSRDANTPQDELATTCSPAPGARLPLVAAEYLPFLSLPGCLCGAGRLVLPPCPPPGHLRGPRAPGGGSRGRETAASGLYVSGGDLAAAWTRRGGVLRAPRAKNVYSGGGLGGASGLAVPAFRGAVVDRMSVRARRGSGP